METDRHANAARRREETPCERAHMYKVAHPQTVLDGWGCLQVVGKGCAASNAQRQRINVHRQLCAGSARLDWDVKYPAQGLSTRVRQAPTSLYYLHVTSQENNNKTCTREVRNSNQNKINRNTHGELRRTSRMFLRSCTKQPVVGRQAQHTERGKEGGSYSSPRPSLASSVTQEPGA